MPKLESGGLPDTGAALRVEDLQVEYGSGRSTFSAVDGISFEVGAGETVSLVGESGCGKSTTARAVVQLPRPKQGSVNLGGTELTTLSGRALRSERKRFQIVLQDPIGSLNPRRRVRDILAEGLAIRSRRLTSADEDRVDEMLEAVGLDPAAVGDRLPREFSGGQCQRISLARALILEPELLILDEPVSALDVSVQAQILNLIEDMKDRYRLSMLFISHDLSVVRSVSDRVIVMYLGRIAEVGTTQQIFSDSAHPYTQLLLSSLEGTRSDARSDEVAEAPSVRNPPSGCRFRTRCPMATERCAAEVPALRAVGNGHLVSCHHPVQGGVVSARAEQERATASGIKVDQ